MSKSEADEAERQTVYSYFCKEFNNEWKAEASGARSGGKRLLYFEVI